MNRDPVTAPSLPFSRMVSLLHMPVRNLSERFRPIRLFLKSEAILDVYNRHLVENKQDATSYQIAFWKKIIYPFSVFVMMALALPFAYLHFRSGGVSLKIFTGIMIGVAFILINNLFSHIGLLNTWPPFLTAVIPSLLFLLSAVFALWWVERH